MLTLAGDDISRLPPAVRTYLVIVSAQGVIDNGGYRYFFGSDWPEQPPYEEFVSAYRTIGCLSQAADLARVAASFPFPDPHCYEQARREFMDQRFDEDTCEVRGWGDALCGDDEVWQRLAEFHVRHAEDFE